MKKQVQLGAMVLTVGIMVACGGGQPPAPAAPSAPVTPAVEPAAMAPAAGNVFYETNFDNVDGWNDNKGDGTFMATILAENGKARLTEAGTQGWGKASRILENIDMDRQPMLVVTVAETAGAKWGLGIVPNPWIDPDYKELLGWQEQPGTQTIDLAATTGWTGKKNVNIVILVSNAGKSVLFDSLQIHYMK